MKTTSALKKFIVFLLYAAIFLIIASLVFIDAYAHHDEGAQQSILSDYHAITGNFYSDDTANKKSIKKLNEFLNTLPTSITETFSKEWAVIVVKEAPTQLQEYLEDHNGENPFSHPPVGTRWTGYNNWKLRLIYIKPQEDTEKLRKVFAHELGHGFDCEFGFLSATDEFYNIYEAYKDTFSEKNCISPQDYAVSTAAEFFATVFQEYCLSPKHLKKEAPQAYDYIDKIYNEVADNPDASVTLRYDLQSAFLTLKNGFRERVKK